jgi:membrane protease subunit HflK
MMNRFNWSRRLRGAPASATGLGDWHLEQNDRPDGAGEPPDAKPSEPEQRPQNPTPTQPSGSHQGPPDLDELWRDFNRKLGRLLGQNRGGRRGGGGPVGGGGGHGGFYPDMKNAPKIIALVVAAVIALWLASGFFMVREGDRAVVTTFGKFDGVRTPGLNWRMPYPIQRDEIVHFSQIRSVDVGGDSVIKNTGLRESGMLTEDENIIEAKFSVQYRLNNARDYLFDTKDPDTAVVQVAESAVREVVGKMTMDTALAEGRDQIAPRIRNLMQSILDRYKVGIDVVAVNMQQGGTRPPEQVQDAFDDVLKAGQEAERTKNEAQAYANNVVPRAKGTAARLTQEAEGYRARVVAQAQGDSQRFLSILPQYEKAPKVTRDRMYIDAMQNIYSGVNKIIIDSRAGGNLLYLPLDKLMAAAGEGAGNAKSTKPDTETPATPSSVPTKPTTDTDSTAGSGRSRSDSRTRFSDFR